MAFDISPSRKRHKAAPNRRSPREATAKYLRNSARYYLDRYATSSAHLRRLLLDKVARSARAHGTDAAAGGAGEDTSGGNGGSRDAIYLSAAGSTTALTSGVVTPSRVTGLGNTYGFIRNTWTNNVYTLPVFSEFLQCIPKCPHLSLEDGPITGDH
ncbi:MAG: hypothetical protein IID48_14400 [Proteobacteria bacterium]|nr:hypothetical protein [Pseudomonadota bacterium]